MPIEAELKTIDGESAASLVHSICCLAGQPSYIADIRSDLRQAGVLKAIAAHDSQTIFNWLTVALSFQGISDAVARNYIDTHGSVTWQDIADRLQRRPDCSKLTSYWHFVDCGYRKSTYTCAAPDFIAACPLPDHRLRNGNLNQLAYSLFFFIRDIAEGDLVGWIDAALARPAVDNEDDRVERSRNALLDPMRQVFGVSDKVLAMALSMLLLGSNKPSWMQVGATMIAVDTLVHNFLHRTGILQRVGAAHRYGTACYQEHGCADVIRVISKAIDARQFNRRFPRNFPRFIQGAIWRYCAQGGLNVCNGNKIDDSRPCEQRSCRVYGRCCRIPLAS